MTSGADRERFARRTAQLLSAMVAALGVAGLLGWTLDIATLKSVFPALASMKVNTALGLLLCGVAAAVASRAAAMERPRQGVVMLLAGVVITLGVLTLLEYLAGADFGIDDWLIRDVPDSIDASNPGRMAAVSALCFVIAGCGLIIAALQDLRFRPAVMAALGMALIVVAGLAIVGYAADAVLHEHWWSYTGMALHTACAFLAFGGALVALARRDAAFTWALGRMVSAGFAAAIAVTLMVAGVVYSAADQLSKSAALVNHTHQALTLLERIDSDMADLENGERGYVILGSEEQLALRDRNKSALRDELVQIRALVADNAAQTPRLDALEPLVGERTRFGEQVIATRRGDGFEPAARLLAAGTASALTAGIDRTIKSLRDAELSLLRVREGLHDEAIRRTFLLLPLGVFLCLALVSLGIFLLNAEAVERAKAARILETMSDAFVSWDRNWLYTNVNAAAERTLGRSREELLGRCVFDVFNLPEGDPSRKQYERAMAENVSVNFEVFSTPLQIWIEVKAYPSAEGGLSVFFRDITERAQHHLALRRSEARLHEAQRIGRIGDWEFDLITNAITWSPQVFEMHGQDPGNGPPRNLDEVVATYDAPSAARLRERVARAIETGQPQEYELVALRRDGATLHTQARAVPRKDSSGRVVMLYGTIQDITERKLAEAALRESQDRFAAFMDNSPAISWIKDAGGRHVYMSHRYEQQFGIRFEDARGKTDFELWPAELAETFRAHDLMVLGDGKPRQFVEETRNSSHQSTYWLSCKFVIHDANGTAYIAGSGIDITERRHAETALQQSEERFRTMANSIPQLAWIARADGYVVWYNRRWHTYTGTTPEQMEGWGWQSVHDPAVLPRVMERWTHAIAVGESFEMEFPLRGADGKMRTFLTRVEPVRDSTGRVVQWFGTNTDVEALKQAEDNVRQLNARLEERVAERTAQLEKANRELAAFSTAVSNDLRVAEAADRMKSAFLATMSHELRTPLNSIIGFTGIVLAGLPGPLNEVQARQLGMVRASAHHLLDVINDVLDLSKIEAGGMDVCLETFDLRASVDQVVAQIRPLAEKKGLALRIADSTFDAPMVSDRRRVDQILLNLLSNAVKFTERGGVTVVIDTFRSDESQPAADRGPRARICIADTGIGIKPEHLALLFQPFRQIDSSLTRKHDGTGLGLAICRRLANLLGGDVQAESTPGKGSVFTVILPVSPLASAA